MVALIKKNGGQIRIHYKDHLREIESGLMVDQYLDPETYEIVFEIVGAKDEQIQRNK
ncbi:MAG: hypothetical protein GY718_04565 [Lentisphaerae bacterium]|nr:hypothetical protein [Lentisphaerota bacterium]